jgi:MscS family membrane protein
MLRATPPTGLLPLALALLLSTPALAKAPTHLPDKEEQKLNEGLGDPPEKLDRSTPFKAWTALLDSCRSGQKELGAHLLNLGEIRKEERKTKGAVLAHNLCLVLKKVGKLTAEGIDDTALGPIVDDKPTNYVIAARFETSLGPREVWLRRFKETSTDSHHWLLTRRTVSEIESWHQMLIKKRKLSRDPVSVINDGLGPVPAKLRLRTPRDTATLFTDLAREGDFDEAARLLDLSKLAKANQKERGERLARRLAMILKRLHPGSFSRISNDPMGSPESGVPFDEEVLARTTLGKAEVQVRLGIYPRTDKDAVWVFTHETVADIDALYDTLGYGWAGDYLPPFFFEWQVWNIQLWQWLGLIIALVLGYIFGLIASYVVRKLLLRLAKLTKWEWDDDVVAAMRGPLVGAFWALGFVVAVAFLALAEKPYGFLLGAAKLVAILSLGWFLMRLMDVAASQLQNMFKAREDDMGMAMIPVARKILKPILFVIVLIVALQNIGVDVSGLLAGLGIGGLAFALAAKDTLANVFGSVAIAFDRPFKVGDFVKVGDTLGTIEDVGLRTTRIRTLDRTVIAIPNSVVADSKIENYAPRDRIRFVATFGVQYDTSLDQVRFIVDEIKRYMIAHPRVWHDSFRVRFIGYGSSSLDIEVYSYVASSDFNEFTAIREELLWGIGEIITGAGAEFAYPSQTVYVGKDSQADSKKATEVATVLTERDAASELSIPEIPDPLREKLLATGKTRVPAE